VVPSPWQATPKPHQNPSSQTPRPDFVGALLITPVTGRNGCIQELRDRGVQIVFVDRRSTKQQRSVSVDDILGGDLAATRLIAQGHERIAFIGGPFPDLFPDSSGVVVQITFVAGGRYRTWGGAHRADANRLRFPHPRADDHYPHAFLGAWVGK